MGQGKQRKLSLSPVQREVLWTLEEAGEETVPTIINTLRLKFSKFLHKELLERVEEAIESLSQHGFVYLSPATGVMQTASVVLTAAGRETLRK
jgi:hypothetical protein